MGLRLVIAVALLAGGVACDSTGDTAGPVAATTSFPPVSSATSAEHSSPEWGETISGVEHLPIPDIAVNDNGGCEFDQAECETWLMPAGVTVTAVRQWYLSRVTPTSRWRDVWEPCFDGRFDSAGVQSDGQETLALSWSRNSSEALALTASNDRNEPVAIIVLRRSVESMPCQ